MFPGLSIGNQGHRDFQLNSVSRKEEVCMTLPVITHDVDGTRILNDTRRTITGLSWTKSVTW